MKFRVIYEKWNVSCRIKFVDCVVKGDKRDGRGSAKKKGLAFLAEKYYYYTHFLCCQLRQKVKFFMTHRTCSLSRIEIKLNCFKFSIFPKPPSRKTSSPFFAVCSAEFYGILSGKWKWNGLTSLLGCGKRKKGFQWRRRAISEHERREFENSKLFKVVKLAQLKIMTRNRAREQGQIGVLSLRIVNAREASNILWGNKI